MLMVRAELVVPHLCLLGNVYLLLPYAKNDRLRCFSAPLSQSRPCDLQTSLNSAFQYLPASSPAGRAAIATRQKPERSADTCASARMARTSLFSNGAFERRGQRGGQTEFAAATSKSRLVADRGTAASWQ